MLVGCVIDFHTNIVPVDGVVSREQRDRPVEANVLIRGGSDECLRISWLVAECGAVRGSNTVSVGSLEQSSVSPSHDEISVQTISSRVGIGERKVSNITSKVASLVEELVEQREQSYWVRLGAHSAIVVANCWVSNMALVVRSVEILAIPTRGEVDLSTYLVTLTGREARGLEGARGPHAHYADGPVCKIGVVLGTTERITSNHSEAVGES